MKKLIAFTMAIIMVMALAACGNTTTKPTATTTTKPTETQATQETQKTPETEATQETEVPQEPETPEIDAQAVYESLVGNYQDSVSQRAMMEVQPAGVGINIKIHWGASAFENGEWNMTATLTKDNKLEYTDGVENHVVYSEDGEATVEEVANNQKGYFTLNDGKLLWDGAADESCKECVFEKLPEDLWPQEDDSVATYPGVYWRSWSEEIGGQERENNAYVVLNEDGTGYHIIQGIGELTWDETQITESIGLTYKIELTQGNDGVKLLIFEFEDENGNSLAAEYEKIDKLPPEIEEMMQEG